MLVYQRVFHTVFLHTKYQYVRSHVGCPWPGFSDRVELFVLGFNKDIEYYIYNIVL